MPCLDLAYCEMELIKNVFDGKIPQIPMVAQLKNGRSIIVNYMTENQISETYCMIQEAAQCGEGYGIDEFESEEEFRMEIKDSDCFAITCKESGLLLAGFIIAVSKFYRGHGAMADPFVIVKRTERKQYLGEFALSTAVKFATCLGYFGMYTDTFSTNKGMLRIVEKIGGFQKVGILPVGGKLQNGQIVSSIIFIKYLKPIEGS
ncbi:uncharacterized protein LOC134691144 [Mytilus trossulus]|uniref:uncharacterized protein LOC134691144 n=1 Tax=Mytilus trossulus TaxID=6551 RepID=UPI0030053903